MDITIIMSENKIFNKISNGVSISIIIPTLNEVECIEMVLNQIPEHLKESVLVVDGHSTDGTAELVKKLGYPLISQPGKGFGDGLLAGVRQVKGDVLVFLLADNSQNPKDIPLLLKKIEDGYDFVMASRYLPGSGSEDNTIIRGIGNRVLTFLFNKRHKVHFSDVLYFMLAMRKEIFEEINFECLGFEFCIELPAKVKRAGFKIGEVPSFERKRAGGKTKVNALKDGWKIFLAILKY